MKMKMFAFLFFLFLSCELRLILRTRARGVGVGREPLASFVEGNRFIIVLHEPLMENYYDRSNLILVITSGS